MNKYSLKELGHGIEIKHGFAFKGEFFSDAGEKIVLTPGNFYDEGGFKYTPGKEKFYTGKIPEDYTCKKGDLIVAMTEQTPGLLGSTALVPEDEKFLHNQRIGLITYAPQKYDKLFLNYLFRTKSVRDQIALSSSGTKVKHTSPKRIYGVLAPKPPLLIQQKIGNFLSSIDSKIELNNKINAELEAMAKLIYDFWFVQFDFPISSATAAAMGKPELEGKPYKSSGGLMVYNQALKREIPEGWEVGGLRKILKHNYHSIGNTTTLEEIEYLDTSSLTRNIVEETQTLNMNEKVPSRAQRIVHPNDILYSTVRPNLCHYGLIKDPKKNMIASTGFVQLTTKSELISNDFLYTFLTSEWITERLQQIAALSVSSYPSISPNDILDLNIALPKNLGELEEVNLKFDNIYSKVSLNQKQNQELSSLRDWLLPMLMNGQVTIKEAEERVSMAAEPEEAYNSRFID